MKSRTLVKSSKIPPSAELVFNGLLHDVYHWDQSVSGGETVKYEAILRHPSVSIIALTDDERVIVIDEEQAFNGRYITIPGGTAESKDYVTEARRELLEETGYAPESIELYGEIDEIVPYSKLEWKGYVFIARGCKKVQDPCLDKGESITVSTRSYGEFISTVMSPDFGISWLSDKFSELMESGEAAIYNSLGITPQ